MASATLGKYQLLAELGRGGMADVFLAVARGKSGLGFSKLVVIKRLREHLANDADFIAMLVDEARIAGRLNHPNVVATLEIDDVDGEYFLVMEYLDGQSLRHILQRFAGSPLFTKPLHYAILCDVLAGLHHAHELTDYNKSPLQVVHRDVTPHNVFVTYDGQVKVLDFGIAKAVGRASETRHGIIKGKIPYMAPEQAAGKVVDRRADIFSVGVMLWEAAVGTRMWQDVKEVDILRSLIQGHIPSSPREADPTIPAPLDAICRKALAHKVDDRYATAEELRTDLEALITHSNARLGPREIGRLISDAFSDKREQIKTIIESQLAKLRVENRESFRPVKIPQAPRSSRADQLALDDSSISVDVDGEVDHVPSLEVAALRAIDRGDDGTKASETPLRSSRLRVLGVVAVGAALVIGVALISALSGHSSPQVSVSPIGDGSGSPAAASSTSSVSPAVSSALPEQIVASFRADPPEARFSVDDGDVLPNPYRGKFARDGVKHRVRIFAPGYVTKNEELTFDDDQSLQLSLARDQTKPKKH